MKNTPDLNSINYKAQPFKGTFKTVGLYLGTTADAVRQGVIYGNPYYCNPVADEVKRRIKNAKRSQKIAAAAIEFLA